MKVGGKNIDTLHQVLFGIIVLVVLMMSIVVLFTDNGSSNKQEIEFLREITEADVALMSEDFD